MVFLDKYRWAGQNIARRGNTKGYENTNTAIKKMINDWFVEYKDANMSFINSYHNHPLGYNWNYLIFFPQFKRSEKFMIFFYFQKKYRSLYSDGK